MIRRGLWRMDWSAADLANTNRALDKFKAFIEYYGFNELYNYFYPTQLTGTTTGNNLAAFIIWCHERDIRVWGMINYGGVHSGFESDGATYIPPSILATDPMAGQTYQQVVINHVNYNSKHPTAKLDGMMIDIENYMAFGRVPAEQTTNTAVKFINDMKACSYSGETMVIQGMLAGEYLDAPYYLAGRPYGTYSQDWALQLYDVIDLVLLNTYDKTADLTVAHANNGPQICASLAIPYMLGLDNEPSYGQSFDGTPETYLSMIADIDASPASNITSYRNYYAGTYLAYYEHAQNWPISEFPPGASKKATLNITIKPANLTCQIEMIIGTSTSGKISFVSTGNAQNINVPITLPNSPGIYDVLLYTYYQDMIIGSYIATEPVIVGAAEWANVIAFNIDHTKIDAPLSDFPILLNLYYVKQIFGVIGGNYKKISIKTADGIECPVEVVSWNNPIDNAEIWFKIPYISNTEDTIFHLCYDNNHADNPLVGLTGSAAAWDVWDNYFVAVYHLSEVGNGSLSDYKDSTRKQHHAQGGGGTASRVPAKAAWGQLFDGVNDLIKIPNHMDFSVDVSQGKNYLDMTAWVKPATLSFTPSSPDGYVRIMGKQEVDPVLGRQGEWHWKFYNNTNSVGAPAGDLTPYMFNLKPITSDRGVGAAISQPKSFEADKWSRIAMIATPDRLKAFLNDEKQENHYWDAGNGSGYTGRMVLYTSLATATPPYGDVITPQHGTSPVAIGAGATNGTFLGDYFNGTIAEIRFSNIERSGAWRKASYYAEADQLVVYP